MKPNKTKDPEKFKKLGVELSTTKKQLKDEEEKLINLKTEFKKTGKKEKPQELRLQENTVKKLKKEVGRITKLWVKSDPNTLDLNREEFEEHCLRRFLFTKSFEIYGGSGGLYDFGPVLCSIKSNILDLWRKHFILEDSMLEIDCAYLTPEKVFKASGHVAKFADFMVKDTITSDCFRCDKLIEEYFNNEIASNSKLSPEDINSYKTIIRSLDGCSIEDLSNIIKKYNIKSPINNKNTLSEPYPFNLMFQTHIGPTGKSIAYLRPETAQGIFVNFKRCLDYNGGQLPMPVATIGRAYRNEISPRSGLIRLREFMLAEIEHFMNPKNSTVKHPKYDLIKDIEIPFFSKQSQDKGGESTFLSIDNAMKKGIIKNYTLAYYIGRTYLFLTKCGIIGKAIRLRQHLDNELAHYATDCWDAEILTSYGWIEVVGLADRSCNDLTNHQKVTKVDLTVFENFDEPIIEDVINVYPNKKLFGKTLKKNAQSVLNFIEKLSYDEKLNLKNEMDKNKKIEINLNNQNDKIEVKQELLELKKEKKKITGKNFLPSVIEPSFGISRVLYCVLEHSYWVRENNNEKEKEEKGKKKKSKKGKKQVNRSVFSFTPIIAPYKASIIPQQINKDFFNVVENLKKKLIEQSISYKIDSSSVSIGRKYSRLDDIGVPFAITVDKESINGDKTVTLRERDSCTQIRASIEDVVKVITQLVRSQTTWDQVQKNFKEQSQTASETVGKKK